ncbi:hypothetical protein KVR01_004375 [Diaporthe batatas]|uniref:uncharacterized protein n=1 Tax=Diaporthe batatas TaxID=748121 RepID=UPI001D044C71|nr:uncharacterized protein KVR01_004375 [Diaporthe batatas]KAG8165823.1 hypothetical protein KVR01_004375 [Diaporthe batatas]
MKHDPNDPDVLRGVRERTKLVNEQVGARFLWDAIRGQPLAHNIDLELVVGADVAGRAQLKAQLEGLESRLRKRSPVLIGHNMLRHLCFLHSTFVGDLPESVQEFRAVTRAELPRIVDTKYLFTEGWNEMSTDFSLAQFFDGMWRVKLPTVVASPPPYCYYGRMYHHPGYDSTFGPNKTKVSVDASAGTDPVWLTGYMIATVFLRRSYQLAQNPTHVLGWYIQEPPPTPAPTPGCERGPSETAAMVPVWGGPFWNNYGNRIRVGPFRLVLNMIETAGEE